MATFKLHGRPAYCRCSIVPIWYYCATLHLHTILQTALLSLRHRAVQILSSSLDGQVIQLQYPGLQLELTISSTPWLILTLQTGMQRTISTAAPSLRPSC